MNTITYWGGLDTIGRCIFSVQNEKGRVIGDFGTLSEEATPKEGQSLVQALIEKNLLPKMPYLYAKEDVGREIKSLEESPYEEQGIFITHVHIDHMGGLKYLPKGVNVYMSEQGKKLYERLIKEGFEPPIQANLIGVPYEKVIKIGDYKVQLLPNDHDTIGTSSILVETAEGRLLHTGDIRWNGYHRDQVKQLIQKVSPVDLLMIEGTSFSFEPEENLTLSHDQSPEDYHSEDWLLRKVKTYLSKPSSLVINPYERNIDRLVALNHLGHDSHRPVVWEKPFAHLIRPYTDEVVYSLVDSKEEQSKENLTWQEVKQQAEKYVVHLTFKHLDRLKELESGYYLHLNGEPLGAYDPRYEGFLKAIEEANFTFEYAGVSGHGAPWEIVDIAKGLSPRLVVPWHTFNPDQEQKALEQEKLQVFRPEEGKTYRLSEVLSLSTTK